jgi:hypothetical protein
MIHHLLPHIDRAFLARARHVLLLRDPASLVASYARTRPTLTLADIGVAEAVALCGSIEQHTGQPPVVVVADDLRREPERVLKSLCARLDLLFDPAMLSWPAGVRDSDGVWGPHWYASVWKSTGFDGAARSRPALSPELEELAKRAEQATLPLLSRRI